MASAGNLLFICFFCFTIAIQEVRRCSAIPLILPLPGQEENLLTLIASARPWTMCSQLYYSQLSENPSIICILYCFAQPEPEESPRNYNLFNLFMQLFRLTSLVQTNSTNSRNSTDIDSTLFRANEIPVSMACATQISCRAALTD